MPVQEDATVYFLDGDGGVLGSGKVPINDKRELPNVSYWHDDYYKLSDIKYANAPAYMKASYKAVAEVPRKTYQLID